MHNSLYLSIMSWICHFEKHNGLTLAISQIGMRNSPRNFESAVIRDFTGAVEINGRNYFLIGVVVGAYRRSSYSIDRIFLFDKERLIC